MLGEIKLVLPPLVAVGVVVGNVLNTLPEGIRIVLDLAALAILFAGFLVLGRLRAQVSASEGAASAWKEERDALALKAERLHDDVLEREKKLSEQRVTIASLEARPTLESLEAEVKKLAQLVSAVASVPKEDP